MIWAMVILKLNAASALLCIHPDGMNWITKCGAKSLANLESIGVGFIQVQIWFGDILEVNYLPCLLLLDGSPVDQSNSTMAKTMM